MCGRFAQYSPDIPDEFEIEEKDDYTGDLPFNWNVAPTQTVKAVVLENERKMIPVRWGLTTLWSQKHKKFFINIREDTLREKTAFSENFKNNRCIIPADGFYEWKEKDGEKIPYFFRLKNNKPMALAGLMNVISGSENKTGPAKELFTCAIITTGANSLMAKLHDRMPVILPETAWPEWLDNSKFDRERLLSLLKPFHPDEMEAYEVGREVNSVKINSPENIKRIEETNQGMLF